MKLTKEKQEALWTIALALVLHFIASRYIHVTETSFGKTYEGPGVIIGTVGLFIWIYGFIKYARAKGRSELLAIILSLFWVPGLIVLLLLSDLKKTKISK